MRMALAALITGCRFDMSLLISSARPGLSAPIIDATDDHVPCVQGQGAPCRRHRRPRIAENLNLVVWAYYFLCWGQLDPAVPAPRADHSIRFRHVVEERGIYPLFSTIFVCDQCGLDPPLFARLNREHHVDKGIPGAKPGHQGCVGAKVRC